MQEETGRDPTESTLPAETEGARGGPISASNYAARAGESLTSTTQQMASFVENLAQVARADACVGASQSVGGHTVVPLAAVSLQTGFGMGFGGGGGSDAGGQEGGGTGGGGGGGGRSSARVIAVVDVSENGVEVKPVADTTTIVLASLAVIGLGLLARGSGGGALRGRLTRMLSRG